ncbi:hypothetical protein PVAND_005845 [Polypedilum vanderplanki]|uniref:BTB domain-containing protein n=1 Tax=Polypedilum vanderplanki TaxID=319348 RepID=A0A9J6C298_POLVA|nr:hypothetical protein PVAND_005845 [Polypedilum vanderplanki]
MQEADCEVISGDGKIFKLHQFILEKNEFFFAMLNSPMIEGQTKVLNLEEKFDILEGIFVYLYSEEIFVSKEKDLFDLFVAANKYLIRNLEKELTENIIKRLTTNNVIQVLLIAEHSNVLLFNSAINFITDNFETIRNSEKWQALTHELKDKIFDKYLEKTKKREQKLYKEMKNEKELHKQALQKHCISPSSYSYNKKSSESEWSISSTLLAHFEKIRYIHLAGCWLAGWLAGWLFGELNLENKS